MGLTFRRLSEGPWTGWASVTEGPPHSGSRTQRKLPLGGREVSFIRAVQVNTDEVRQTYAVAHRSRPRQIQGGAGRESPLLWLCVPEEEGGKASHLGVAVAQHREDGRDLYQQLASASISGAVETAEGNREDRRKGIWHVRKHLPCRLPAQCRGPGLIGGLV